MRACWVALLVLTAIVIILPVLAAPTISLGEESWGSKWYNGTGSPSGTLGSIDDFYLDDDTGNIYTKPGASWAYIFTMATSDSVDTTQFYFLNGTRTLTGLMNAGGFNLTNLGAPTASNDAATKKYVDDEIAGIGSPDTSQFYYLNGTRALTGDMNAGGYDLTNLSAPDSDLEAATKKYVDDEISGISMPDTSQFYFLNGTRTLAGDMNAGGYDLTNLSPPDSDLEAATKKYVDDEIAGIGSPDTSQFYYLNGTRKLTGDMDAGGYDLTNLSAPDSDLEAATKKYVDDEIAGVGGITLEDVYPVGSIYIATVSTNPNTLFGFGTWAAFGTGRVLVGINGADADFDTGGETGGAKTVSAAGSVAAPTFTGTPSSVIVNHVHPVNVGSAADTSGTSGAGNYFAGTTSTVTATTNNPTGGSASYTPAGTNSAPAFTGSATSVVQPYIVVYMWERTA